MNLSKFFIDRPIFAAVVSVLTTVVGALALASSNVTRSGSSAPS